MYGGLAFGGDGIWFQSCVALPTTTIGMVSMILHLPLPFSFCIVSAFGTDWGSHTLASAFKSRDMRVPVDVEGWLLSVRGSTWFEFLSSMPSSTCKYSLQLEDTDFGFVC